MRPDDGACLVGLPDSATGGGEGVVDRNVAREVPRPIQPQVHPQPEAVVELEEHLLADRLGLDDLVPVKLGRA